MEEQVIFLNNILIEFENVKNKFIIYHRPIFPLINNENLFSNFISNRGKE